MKYGKDHDIIADSKEEMIQELSDYLLSHNYLSYDIEVGKGTRIFCGHKCCDTEPFWYANLKHVSGIERWKRNLEQ